MINKKSLFSLLKKDIIQELFISGIGCLLSYLLMGLLPERCWDPIYRTTILMILGISFFLCFLILNQASSRRKFFKINYKRNIILFSIFVFSIWCFLFYQTSFGFLGVVSDNYYRSAFITQMAYSGYPKDYAYKNLSAFYSPFYYYCLAIIAIIFNIPPYKMVKIGFLLAFYILPILLFEFWKKIYKKKIAFIITVLSIIIIGDIYSIDKMIGYMLFIPYFIYYFENYPKKEINLKYYIVGGLIGAIIFTTFFLFFLAIPIYFIIKIFQDKKNFIENFKRLFKLTTFLLIFSSWFWVPLSADIILIGFESHQNRYYNPSILTFPLLSYLALSTFGLIFTIGAIYIIKKYSSSQDFKILGNLLISIDLLFLFGLIGVLIHFPIMHIRFLYVSFYILIISMSIFYVKFFYFLKTNRFLKNAKYKVSLKQIEVYLIIGFFFFQYIDFAVTISTSDYYEYTLDEDYPADLIDIFEELDYEDKVFLTSKWKVAAFIPIYLFLLPSPYYNHPSALYNERVKFLIDLSECDNSKDFHDKIVKNQFESIDYFFLDFENNDTVLVLEIAIEKFPEGREYYEIKFDRLLFQDIDLFKEIVIENKIIYKTKY